MAVVGAGPAGLSAARSAATKGLKVIVLEKKREVGSPLKCAGFLPSASEMRKLLPEAEGFLGLLDFGSDVRVHRCRVVEAVFPSGRKLSARLDGQAVDRRALERSLAQETAKAGATLSLNSRVWRIEGRTISTVVEGEERKFEAKVVVGADGAHSVVAAQYGERHRPEQLAFCYAHEYRSADIDPDCVRMFFGRDFAPGGFAWLIPHGLNLLNLGIGIRDRYRRAGDSLNSLRQRFLSLPQVAASVRRAQPLACIAAHVPIAGPRKRTAFKDALLVGDAAGQVLPHVGSGVATSIIAGEIAGSAIYEYLANRRPLTSYEADWRRVMGEVLESSLKIRAMLERFVERDWLLNRVPDLIGEEAFLQLLMAHTPRGIPQLLSTVLWDRSKGSPS